LGLATGTGMATNGVDFTGPGGQLLPLSVFFAAGQDKTTVDVEIFPLADAISSEGAENVQLSILPSSLYAIAGAPSATVVISDGQSIDLGAVSGRVFNDSNGDGAQTSGEAGAAGWQVVADLDQDGIVDAGEPTATTDGSGNYTIPGLAAGAYQLLLAPKA